KGLFYGDPSQFIAQAIGITSNFIYVGLVSIIIFKFIDIIVGNRVDPDSEIEGLDVPEMGVVGYSGVKLDKHSETPIPKELFTIEK
ncbi:MAG: ammonium transporter, partial [Candidatus Omnitrophica bacterium]|nr:ammonium transporter [Candidatus Omnitrophota bacterium]